MGVLLAVLAVIALVLVLGELSAMLWRRRHPPADRFERFRQWRVFCGLWMVVAAVAFGVLAGTRVLPIGR